MQPSPFQSIAPKVGGVEATPVHHDAPGGNKDLLNGLINKHSAKLGGYMGRIKAGESLNDAEYHDYHSTLKNKQEAINELDKEDTTHANIKARDKGALDEADEAETRAQIQKNITKFNSRGQ